MFSGVTPYDILLVTNELLFFVQYYVNITRYMTNNHLEYLNTTQEFGPLCRGASNTSAGC